MIESEQLKREGIEQVSQNWPTWTDRAVDAIRVYALAIVGEFTSDEVRKFSSLPDAPNPNCWGAAFNAAAKLGIIEATGYRRSTLKSAHSRVVTIWKRK